MLLFDTARRYLNDKPMLISFNANVVPFLMIFPEREENKTRISAMVPASGQGRYESRSVSKIINTIEIPKILEAYRLDPENTLETLFDLTLVLSEPSDNDLARSIRKAHESSLRSDKKELNVSLDDRIASIEL